MRLTKLTAVLIVLAAHAMGGSLAMGDGARASPGKKTPSVLVPEAGTYPAQHLFPLVAKVSNRPIKPTGDKVAQKPVTISPELAGQRLKLDGLTLLLAAHGVFLHRHVTKDGEVLVASASRFWKPRSTPMYTHAFTVSPRRYTTAVREVEQLLAKANQGKSKRVPDSVVLPVAATGRLIVRSASTWTLDEVGRLIKIVETDGVPRDPTRTRLFAFRPAHYPGTLLQKRLSGFLDQAEWNQLHIVIPRGPNAMWIRTTPALWTKVHRILTLADTPGVDWPGEPPIKKLPAASGSPAQKG